MKGGSCAGFSHSAIVAWQINVLIPREVSINANPDSGRRIRLARHNRKCLQCTGYTVSGDFRIGDRLDVQPCMCAGCLPLYSKRPLGWTQELSVFSLILSVMFGIAAAFWHGEHFHVSLLRDSLPSRIGNIMRFIGRAVTIVFLSTVIWQSYALSLRAMRQVSPTTGIPIGDI